MIGLSPVTEKYVNWDEVPVILDTQQVADLLGVHINTVKVWIREGTIPSFKAGRSRKFHKSEIMRFVGLESDD